MQINRHATFSCNSVSQCFCSDSKKQISQVTTFILQEQTAAFGHHARTNHESKCRFIGRDLMIQ
uniref:Uncharacterized protein n=1 Tax=Oryza brachyantha TaxID=4533 RepID=J3N0X8_ORYBR